MTHRITIAGAGASRSSLSCAVCGSYKDHKRALCDDCLDELNQPERNEIYASAEGFLAVVEMLRTRHAAKAVGFTISR
jgi:hypothetical protein